MIVIGLSLGVCVSNGFARFAYGLILPAMKDDLHWNFSQAGWINSANAIGYILGAIAAFALLRHMAPVRLFKVGLVATTFSLLLTGLTDDFWLLTLWRLCTGISAAPVFVAGGALAATLFPTEPKKNALAIAAYFGGGGVGMIISGCLLPGLFAVRGVEDWPISWILLAVGSLLCIPVSFWSANNIPDAGGKRSDLQARPQKIPVSKMLGLLLAYSLFAAGHIMYLTFLVAWMERLQAGVLLISGAWVMIGLCIIVSPFVWRGILARHASGVPLALSTAVVGIGSFLPFFWQTAPGLILSAVLFGIAVFIGPSAVTNFGKQNLPPQAWGRSVGIFTIVFACGQALGPIGAGWVIDATGKIENSLAFAGCVLIAGAVAAIFQRPLADRPE